MHIRYLICLLPLFAVTATPARAQLTVCLGISVTASPLTFSYTPSSPAPNSTPIKFSCGLGLFVLPDITVSLNGGNASSFPRQMSPASGSERLLYNIYTTNGYGTVWGDGTGGTQTQSVNGALLGVGSYTFTGWGLVPAGQYITATTYTDKITVLVTF